MNETRQKEKIFLHKAKKRKNEQMLKPICIWAANLDKLI